MDRISGDIREDRRPKVQDTWVTVCESLRRKDRECLQRSVCCFVMRVPYVVQGLFLLHKSAAAARVYAGGDGCKKLCIRMRDPGLCI